MWKYAAFGAALIAAGSIRLNSHLAELGREAALQDFLAVRCGGGAPLPGAGHVANDGMLLAAAHCWGCYAMAAGVAVLGFALWQLAMPRLSFLRRK